MPVEFPRKATPLFEPAPFKVMHGGRGSSKSWNFARALLILGSNRKLFIVCAREIQRSIRESVHKLLRDQIDGLGLAHFYRVTETEIEGLNGTRIVFVGIRNNVSAIKSMEGIDIFAVFEATFVSHASWEIVLPTVRRDAPYGPFALGSEIWLEFNPELASDYTYKYWVADPPADTVVVEMNWRDNPWFPDNLRKQMLEMKERDFDSYLTVWEGKTRKTLEGSIYAKELSRAILEDRVNPHIRVDRSKPVQIAFDLGRSDMCALWFMQQVGTEHHAIDFYGNTGFGIDHYLEEIQNRRYIISRILLPHDAANFHQAAAKTIERQVRDAYPGDGKVRIVPKVGITNGINAVRALFPRMYFNEVTCADGLLALQHYQFAVNPQTKARAKEPLHNWASNPADALRYYAVMMREGDRKPEPQEMEYDHNPHSQSWMV